MSRYSLVMVGDAPVQMVDVIVLFCFFVILIAIVWRTDTSRYFLVLLQETYFVCISASY